MEGGGCFIVHARICQFKEIYCLVPCIFCLISFLRRIKGSHLPEPMSAKYGTASNVVTALET